jgi:putative ubiquitin-RnfH superfamily antitoxin RatB of RatAB toxin-antitoxin module
MARDEVVIEVACATPDKQVVTEITVSAGTTIAQAIQLSGIAAQFPELDIDGCQVGIYSQLSSRDAKVVDGDRVEIYRELLLDPKEARLRRARTLKNQGNSTG